MTALVWATVAGAGVASLLWWWLATSYSLDSRVAPWARLTPGGRAERTRAWRGRLAARFDTPAASLGLRLARAGLAVNTAQYRLERAAWAAAGAGVGVVISLVVASSRGGADISTVGLVVAGGVAGYGARDVVLARATRARDARLLEELPAVAEMLALAVSAGEGVGAALERVSRLSGGDLAAEIRVTLADARTGVPLSDALRALADRTQVAPLRRFADAIGVAIDRGTPLADVLHAQAMDVREAGRRQLIEEGGRREIAMMIPVVFLILPVTVAFAVFPGVIALRLGS